MIQSTPHALTRLLARAWPEDDADRLINSLTADSTEHFAEDALDEVRRSMQVESAKAVVEVGFLLCNLTAGAGLSIAVVTSSLASGGWPTAAAAIALTQSVGIVGSTSEHPLARATGYGLLSAGTVLGVGLVLG